MSADDLDDPFEALLSTARRIGFEIPAGSKSFDDVQRASFVKNLHQLVEVGRQIPLLRSELSALERNRAANGYMDPEEIRRLVKKLDRAADVLSQFSERKMMLAERLLKEDVHGSIPVEVENQTEFKQLIHVIAQDKYKLFEMISLARTCVESDESPVCWKSQVESVRGVYDQLEAACKSMDEVSQMINNCTMGEGYIEAEKT